MLKYLYLQRIRAFLHLYLKLWKTQHVKLEPSYWNIEEKVLKNPKLVFFTDKTHATMLWTSSGTCDVVNVAKKPYLEVTWVN